MSSDRGHIHIGARNADPVGVPAPHHQSTGVPSDSEGRPGAFAALAALLWTVRETLETVQYALVVERLVVTDGSVRWLPRADADVVRALDALRSVEVLRAAEVDEIAHQLGLAGEQTLSMLAAMAPEPWPDLFAEHREALRACSSTIDQAIAENARVLASAVRKYRMPAVGSSRPQRDEQKVVAAAAYRAALATLATAPQLSLQDFLR